MAYYRLYVMSPGGSHIEAFEEIYAADDGEASSIAATRLGGKPLELWCRGRKVARFEPETAAAAE